MLSYAFLTSPTQPNKGHSAGFCGEREQMEQLMQTLACTACCKNGKSFLPWHFFLFTTVTDLSFWPTFLPVLCLAAIFFLHSMPS